MFKHWSTRLETIEILLRVDVLQILKNIAYFIDFSRFWNYHLLMQKWLNTDYFI